MEKLSVTKALLPAITARNAVEKLRSPSEKIEFIVQVLRAFGDDDDILREKLIIPDECEKYGFKEGYYSMGELLHFIGDMIEE